MMSVKCANRTRLITDNRDIITEIILYLSIEDLLRLKSVCKQWHSIISDPFFGYHYFQFNPRNNFVAGLFLYQLHEPHSPQINFVYLKGKPIKDPFRSLNFADGISDIHRIWSCNGLLCICVKSYDAYGPYARSKSYYICNPTTNQSTRLPNPVRFPITTVLAVTLAFDPRKSIHYKVVAVCVYELCYQFMIYSSETKLWKHVLSLKIGNDDNFLFETGVFWRNAVHWISPSGSFLCFDVDNECLKTMPASPIGKSEIGYFGESFGHLHLVKMHYNMFEVLELEADYSRWVVLRQVNLNQLGAYSRLKWRSDDIRILCVLRSMEMEDVSLNLVVATPVGALLLSMSDIVTGFSCRLHHIEQIVQKKGKNYVEQGIPKYKWYHASQYIMSLASV